MKKYTALILASLFVSACQHNQSPFIETIQTLRDVHFEDIETDAPVIFDIDETLIQPMDTYLINEHILLEDTISNVIPCCCGDPQK